MNRDENNTLLAMLTAIDPDVGTTLLAEVETLRSLAPRRLAVVGEYSAGKTSMLKRFCVEQGLKPPADARVAAGPATGRAQDVPFGTCVLVDTPGLSSGTAGHAESAWSAAMMADGIVLVLPPALFTGDVTRICSLITSDVPKLVLVSRMDSAGIDPADDSESYESLKQTKRNEFDARLDEWKLQSAWRPRVCFVAPDPYQAVGDLPHPTTDNYVRAPWDGVPEAINEIQHLAKRLDREHTVALHVARRRQEIAVDWRVAAGELLSAAKDVEDVTKLCDLRQRIAILMDRREVDARSIAREAARDLEERIRGGLEVPPEAVDRKVASLAEALDSWASETKARFDALLIDSGIDTSVPTFYEANLKQGFGGYAPDDEPTLWASHAKRVSYLLSRVGKWIDADPKQVEARIRKWNEVREHKARPWEIKNTVVRWKKVGESISAIATFAPEALALVDEVRGWLAQQKAETARARAAEELGKLLNERVDALLDGEEETPGVRRWARRLCSDLDMQVEAAAEEGVRLREHAALLYERANRFAG